YVAETWPPAALTWEVRAVTVAGSAPGMVTSATGRRERPPAYSRGATEAAKVSPYVDAGVRVTTRGAGDAADVLSCSGPAPRATPVARARRTAVSGTAYERDRITTAFPRGAGRGGLAGRAPTGDRRRWSRWPRRRRPGRSGAPGRRGGRGADRSRASG